MRYEKEDNMKSQLRFNPDGTITLPRELKEKLIKEKEQVLDIWDQEEHDDLVHNIEDNLAGFNLYQENNKLNVLKFSNQKTQEDIVNEVSDLIKNGEKIIFVHGVCGSGKSAMALNIAKELGKSSIVVPGKALQKQYMDDYSKNKYVLKKDHKKLKIKIITGRENHRCLFKELANAANDEIPCKIEIKEKNIHKLREYLKQNPKVSNDLDLKNIKRMSIAPICPYWSPIVPSHLDLNLNSSRKKYQGLNNTEYTVHSMRKGCTYYNQFDSYVNGEVLVFNSAKYVLETAMNRKPETKVEIIDECDEFLDSFSNVSTINLNRFANALNNVFPEDEKLDFIIRKIIELTGFLLTGNDVKELVLKDDILKIKESKIYELFNYFLDNPELLEDIDEDNYAHNVNEIALVFSEIFSETYVRFRKEERGLMLDLVSVNLAEKFKELIDKNNAFVLMSGTLHSKKVLKDIFGISDFSVVDAETVNQGVIEIKETGFEKDCKYQNFIQGNITREEYLIALNETIESSIKPTLVHVNSFNDLPSEEEKQMYNLYNLMTKNKLLDLQKNNSGKLVEKFKEKQISVLFTTKCNRGVDFPGNQCRSVVFTKFPNPNANGIFWKILRETHKEFYWEFYKDKAKREFMQKIYRGLRSKEDHIYLLSPDKRVLDAGRLLIRDIL